MCRLKLRANVDCLRHNACRGHSKLHKMRKCHNMKTRCEHTTDHTHGWNHLRARARARARTGAILPQRTRQASDN